MNCLTYLLSSLGTADLVRNRPSVILQSTPVIFPDEWTIDLRQLSTVFRIRRLPAIDSSAIHVRLSTAASLCRAQESQFQIQWRISRPNSLMSFENQSFSPNPHALHLPHHRPFNTWCCKYILASTTVVLENKCSESKYKQAIAKLV